MFLPLFGEVLYFFFGFCFIPDECGGHSAEVANKKSTFPPFSFESNKRFHVNHPALAGRDREKKGRRDSSLSPLFFCLLGFVSLAGRRAIGRRSFFLFRCVWWRRRLFIKSIIRSESSAVRTWGACSHATNSIGRELSVCVPVYIFQFPPPYSYGNSSVVQYAHISSFPLLPDNKLMTSNICIVSRGLLFFRAWMANSSAHRQTDRHERGTRQIREHIGGERKKKKKMYIKVTKKTERIFCRLLLFEPACCCCCCWTFVTPPSLSFSRWML